MVKTERKESILSAAEELFAEKGFYVCSISDIIQKAGIARGTFYLYFDSKKSIFDELLDGFFEAIDERVKRINIHDESVNPMAELRNNIMRVAELLYERGNLTRIVLMYASGVDTDFDQKIKTFYNRILSMIEGAVRLGVEMEILKPSDHKVVSLCILGCVKQVATAIIDEEYSVENIEKIVDDMIQFALTGILIR